MIITPQMNFKHVNKDLKQIRSQTKMLSPKNGELINNDLLGIL